MRFQINICTLKIISLKWIPNTVAGSRSWKIQNCSLLECIKVPEKVFEAELWLLHNPLSELGLPVPNHIVFHLETGCPGPQAWRSRVLDPSSGCGEQHQPCLTKGTGQNPVGHQGTSSGSAQLLPVLREAAHKSSLVTASGHSKPSRTQNDTCFDSFIGCVSCRLSGLYFHTSVSFVYVINYSLKTR